MNRCFIFMFDYYKAKEKKKQNQRERERENGERIIGSVSRRFGFGFWVFCERIKNFHSIYNIVCSFQICTDIIADFYHRRFRHGAGGARYNMMATMRQSGGSRKRRKKPCLCTEHAPGLFCVHTT